MVQFRTYMTDANRFLTSPDVQDELRAQGRVLFTDGSWSPQGFADEEHGVNPSENVSFTHLTLPTSDLV